MSFIIRTNKHPYTQFVNELLEEKRRQAGQTNEFENTATSLALDVDENENHYTVYANLPGVSLDNISVNIHDDVLMISAESNTAEYGEDTRVLVRERRTGKFNRSLRFPVAVNGDAVEASFDNGVLTIIVPKAEEAKPRQIPVTMAGSHN